MPWLVTPPSRAGTRVVHACFVLRVLTPPHDVRFLRLSLQTTTKSDDDVRFSLQSWRRRALLYLQVCGLVAGLTTTCKATRFIFRLCQANERVEGNTVLVIRLSRLQFVLRFLTPPHDVRFLRLSLLQLDDDVRFLLQD